MSECFLSKRIYIFFLYLYIAVAFWLLYFTPLTPSEANILFSNENHITNFIIFFIEKFTNNKIALRLPFFIISLLSFKLYIDIAKSYFKNKSFLYLSIIIYLIIPGTFISFIIINYATVAIFLILLFIYSYHKKNIIIESVALMLLIVTNTAQFAVFIGVALYTFRKKEWYLFGISIFLIILSSIEATYAIDGIPRGHLTNLFGVYGAVLSPFYFIYLIYALYYIGIKSQKDIMWYIVVAVFIMSLLLSIRQKINVTDFTPYLVIAVPLAVKVFEKSISIRLKEFRNFYFKVCTIIVIVLLLETLLIVFNYPIYILSDKKIQIANKNIYKIEKSVKKLEKNAQKCLKFIKSREKNLYKYYGITVCN